MNKHARAIFHLCLLGAAASCADDAPVTINDVGDRDVQDTQPDSENDVVDVDVADADPDADADAIEETEVDLEVEDAPDSDTAETDDAVEETDDADAPEDLETTDTPDTILESCGNGEVDPGEECDDGNAANDDLCTTSCAFAACGDGFVNLRPASFTVSAQVFRSISGEDGYVCGRGSSCAGDACAVTDDAAPEHGICQSLGSQRAVFVDWTGAVGAGTRPMLEAYNWACFGYECFEGVVDTDDNCEAGEMLASIECEGFGLEPCDDGDRNSATEPSACRPNCELPRCGDGVQDAEEGCDDGNSVNNDGCSNNCLRPQCGDGVLQAAEICDDGNADNTDSCTNSCVLPVCGDGFAQPSAGEECDEGANNSDRPNSCRGNCQLPACGDRVLDDAEQCDDGNTTNTDGCSNNCQLPGCGDAIEQAGEQCDDGNDVDTDACLNDCTEAICGDGIVAAALPCSVLLLSEPALSSSAGGVANILREFTDEVTTQENTGSAVSANAENLTDYSLVIFSKQDRNITASEEAALTEYVSQGGTLVITGYDSLGSPTDNLLANVAQISTTGDGPFSGAITVSTDHPYVNGPFGVYAVGDGFTVSSTDHDLAAVIGDTIEILRVSGTHAKLTYASIGAGLVIYWNGNSSYSDWTAAGAAQNIFRNMLSTECTYGEECDNGVLNADTANACRTDCSLPFCGDGIVDDAEQCDDGNDVATDDCNNSCALPVCGDGLVGGSEQCDDGNDVNDDVCNNFCERARCGDGVVNVTLRIDTVSGPIVTNPNGAVGHVCDDGGTCQGGTCDVSANGGAPEHGICQALGYDSAVSVIWGGGPGETDVVMPSAFNWTCTNFVCTASTQTDATDNCGSGEMLREIVCRGGGVETCDDGEDNALAPDACRPDCSLPACGDTVVDSGEECDDGNTAPGDTCSAICLSPICGDAEVNPGEQCDDGDDNSDTADNCRTSCALPICRDGIVDTGEQCDDGNEVADDGCSLICRTPGCLDGVLQDGEQCDDGNNIGDDDCDNSCQLPVCGDGIIEGDEECDDQDTDNDDECGNDCLAARCGDGRINLSELEINLTAPIVTNPSGASGHVCDDGGSCFGTDAGTTCDVSANGNAPEHGICQALGYDRAISVTWGGGPGQNDTVMPSAFNWTCTDYVCTAATDQDSTDNCTSTEMLASIRCLGAGLEACDDGEANGNTPDACRATCTLPVCGDGVVDTGEQCDDGNRVARDNCNNVCRLPVCGNGVRQGDEQCDDGNDVDDDFCSNSCVGQDVDFDLESRLGAVHTGTTVGFGNELTTTPCNGGGGLDVTFGWIAPSTGDFEIDVCGAAFDSVLYALNNDTEEVLSCSDDTGCAGNTSAIIVSVEAGTPYLIVVDGYGNGDTGNFTLNINPAP
jgi:cysteine-rich repeat protein